jgi:hypothetical protein
MEQVRALMMILRWLPWIAGVVVLGTAGPLGWSRDFGLFLLGLFVYLPIVVLACYALILWALRERRTPRLWPILATLAVVVVMTPATLILANQTKDQARFVAWYLSHRELADSYANADAVITDWDSWGFAGNENFSYLVAARDDSMTTPDAATAWVQRRAPDCEAAGVKQMAHGLYVVTTYNCTL